MYVRMSTDLQKYSIENQEEAIREYAARHHIDIVRTYADSGRSGLSLDGREALQALIHDVQAGGNDYEIILVLDVSRWGRFQDADESAYYEFMCRSLGFEVRYVAEQFENDGTPISTIIKGIKRAMAGEYSRELSRKVRAGQRRLIEKGFWQTGSAGYGLRKMLIDEHGRQKFILEPGQQKSLQTDRIKLVPGPDAEVELIRWIFRSYAEERLTEGAIASQLNARGLTNEFGRPWNRSAVHSVLSNEKYIGNIVFNRSSGRLARKRFSTPPEEWIRYDGAFEAIVDPDLFHAARRLANERTHSFSDAELLAKLQHLWKRRGWLSIDLINETEDMPSSRVYAERFGGLRRAYQLIGYSADRNLTCWFDNELIRKMHPEIIDSVVHRMEALGAKVRREERSGVILINDEVRVSIVICRCFTTRTHSGRWTVYFDSEVQSHITIVARLEMNGLNILDYYVIPSIDVEGPSLKIRSTNHLSLDAYRVADLDRFVRSVERSTIYEVAHDG